MGTTDCIECTDFDEVDVVNRLTRRMTAIGSSFSEANPRLELAPLNLREEILWACLAV